MEKKITVFLLCLFWMLKSECSLPEISYNLYSYLPPSQVVQYRISDDGKTIIYIDSLSILYKIENNGTGLNIRATLDCSSFNILSNRALVISPNGSFVMLTGQETNYMVRVEQTRFVLEWSFTYSERKTSAIAFRDFRKVYVQNLFPYDLEIYRVQNNTLFKSETFSKEGQRYYSRRQSNDSKIFLFITAHSPPRLYVLR